MGLAGNAIPLEARILNLCDSVEAMASDRPYHRAMSTQQIMLEAHRCAGTQFDPAIVKAFERVMERRGATFIVNSARSIAAQYSSSLVAAEGIGRQSSAGNDGFTAVESKPRPSAYLVR